MQCCPSRRVSTASSFGLVLRLPGWPQTWIGPAITAHMEIKGDKMTNFFREQLGPNDIDETQPIIPEILGDRRNSQHFRETNCPHCGRMGFTREHGCTSSTLLP